MPRSLPAAVSSAITGTVTSPEYLIYLGFGAPLYYATKQDRTWDGDSWTASGAEVKKVNAREASVTLRNHDQSASALVLNNSLHDVVCKIYAYYDSDAEEIFSGRLDSAPEIGERVTLIAKAAVEAIKYPNTYITPPVFNHVSPAGKEIIWGSRTVMLEGENG